MSTGLAGVLVRQSNKKAIQNVVVEIRNTTTGAVTTTATTNAQGYFSASGLASATYAAVPRQPGDDWAIQPALDYYTVGGTDVSLADGGTGASLVDPNADRIFFWDDSAGASTWLAPGNSVAITGTTLDTVQNLQTTGNPQFATVELGAATDTTLSRASAGVMAVEGKNVYMVGGADAALADGGTGASLVDPNADRMFFWDDSAGATDWLTPGSSLAITTTTIDAIQDIRTSASPQFTGLTVTNLPTIHGAAGVNISDAQTLTNKIISATGTTIPAIIAPNTIGLSGSALTTSGTTELTILSQTITNPNVAGQLIAWAVFSYNSPTVAGDLFTFRLKIGTTPTTIAEGVDEVRPVTTDRRVVTLVGTAPVAASGTQIVRMTVVRASGTGTLTLDQSGGTRCTLTWLILPGAGTTA